MRKILLIAAISACIPFSVFTQETKHLNEFNTVKVDGRINVILTLGNENFARIESTTVSVNQINTEVSNGTLLIKPSKKIKKGSSVDIYLTCSSLNAIEVGKGGRVSVQQPIIGDTLLLSAKIKTEINATVKANHVKVFAKNGGTIRMSGETKSLEAKISSGGILSALDLKSEDADLVIGNKAVAKVDVANSLHVKVKSFESLTYSGQPQAKKIKTGFGSKIFKQ